MSILYFFLIFFKYIIQQIRYVVISNMYKQTLMPTHRAHEHVMERGKADRNRMKKKEKKNSIKSMQSGVEVRREAKGKSCLWKQSKWDFYNCDMCFF